MSFWIITISTHYSFYSILLYSMTKEFLLLDEITKSSVVLPQEEKEEASVEIQDLICYWDKVLSTTQQI